MFVLGGSDIIGATGARGKVYWTQLQNVVIIPVLFGAGRRLFDVVAVAYRVLEHRSETCIHIARGR